MKSSIALKIAVPLIACILSSCDGGPPKSTITEAISAGINGSRPIVDYVVTNEYTRKHDDETYHIVDLSVVYQGRDPNEPSKLTMAFVKRGNRWFHTKWDDSMKERP